MTTGTTVTVDEQNPWPGLAPFDEAAERFFKGRRIETSELRRFVLQSPLTLVFGASGLGKTSLLRAGLAPALGRDAILPVYVRLDVLDRTQPLVRQLADALEAATRSEHADARPIEPAESLWHYLHRRDVEIWSRHNKLLTPLFVLDQFEEVFTLGDDNREAVATLRADLADLIENRISGRIAAQFDESASKLALDGQRYRFLFSFREDFLPALETWSRDIPSVMRNRFRLMPMTDQQAFEAVHTTAPHLADPDIARQIVSFVAAARGGDQLIEKQSGEPLIVEPALLSLICHGLNERRKAQGKSRFDQALLAQAGHSIVEDFYDTSLADQPARVPRFIEKELITERGYRKACDVDDARIAYGVTAGELRTLVDRRLLRIETQRGTNRVELTHDLLTSVVRAHRERQRQTERSRIQRRRVAALSVVGLMLGVLVIVFYALFRNAAGERAQAIQARAVADENRARADAARGVAETLTSELQTQAKALHESVAALEQSRQGEQLQALRNLSRRLAVESELMQSQGGPALLLAIESMRRAPTAAGDSTLRNAIHLLPRVTTNVPADPDSGGRLPLAALSPDGAWLILSTDRATQVIDAANGTTVTQVEHSGRALEAAVSGDGRLLLTRTAVEIQLSNRETGVRLWKVQASRGLATAVFSPDSRRVAAGIGHTAILFDAATGREVWRKERENDVRVVAVSGDSQWVAIGDSDQMVLVSTTSGTEVWHREAGSGDVILSHDAQWVAFGTRGTLNWQVVDRASARAWDGLALAGSGGSIKDSIPVAFAPLGGSTVITVNDGRGPGTTIMLDAGSGVERWRLENCCTGMAFVPDGTRIVLARDNSLHLLETATGRILWTRTITGVGVHSPVVSADGRQLFVRQHLGSSSDRILYAFDVASGALRARSETYPDGAAISGSRWVVTNLQAGVQPRSLQWTTSIQVFEANPLTHSIAAEHGVFDAQGNWTSVRDEGRERLGSVRQAAGDALVVDLISTWALSPNKRWLAIGGSKSTSFVGFENGNFAQVLEVATGRSAAVSPRIWTGTLASGEVRALTFSADSTLVASGTVDGVLRVFTAVGGQERFTRASLGSITALAFSTAGRYLAVGGAGKVVVLDARNGEERSRVPLEGDVAHVAFTEESRHLMVASKPATNSPARYVVTRHLLDPIDLAREACSRATRNLTTDEWRQYVGAEEPYRKTCSRLP